MMQRTTNTLFVLLVLIAILGGVLLTNTNASAVIVGFNPGRIIDNEVFTNKTSMSVGDIQMFLNAKVPACDTYGTQMYNSWQTRAQFAATIGQHTPFTCLKDYNENGRSAARIIFDTAQQYQINPQVLLVLLQKEQALVTDSWPYATQYQRATGYRCPDTAPCDSLYFGFSNQLKQAANMFHQIMIASPYWYTPYILGNNFIRYSPTVSCGGSNVYIENRATQALYNYTPYQPNQASLDAGWGSTPSCGAYGNRNFYLYYTNWFGSTYYTPPYRWSFIGQAAYTDLSFANPLPQPYKFTNGQKIFYTVVARNTGTATWVNSGSNPLKLGTVSPNDRQSSLCENSWSDCGRPSLLSQPQVLPGQYGTFGFWITAPQETGQYSERLSLVSEGQTWLNDPGFSFDFEVIPSYRWSPQSVKFYLDSARTKEVGNDSLTAGETSYSTLTVKNMGNTTWSNTNENPIRLGSIYDIPSRYCSSSWISCGRAARMTESNVAPGQTATFNFEVSNPKGPSAYGESFNLVIEGSRWMIPNDYHMWLATTAAKRTWSVVESKLYTDESMKTSLSQGIVNRSQRIYCVLKVKNTGNTLWLNAANTPVRLGTFNPRDHKGIFYDPRWIDPARTAVLNESVVYPGDTGTFTFWLTTPTQISTYSESYNIVREGSYWLQDANYFLQLSAI